MLVCHNIIEYLETEPNSLHSVITGDKKAFYARPPNQAQVKSVEVINPSEAEESKIVKG